MKARLVRGGIGVATTVGTAALGLAAPASAGNTGIPTLEKIKQCESGGDYAAENPYSTASGAYQFIDSTFQSLSASQGYKHASSAPASVQDAAAIELYNEQGTSPWAASASCWQASGASGPASETNTGGTSGGGTGSSSGGSSSGGSSSGGAAGGSSSGGSSAIPGQAGGVQTGSKQGGTPQAPTGGSGVGVTPKDAGVPSSGVGGAPSQGQQSGVKTQGQQSGVKLR